MTSLFLSLSPGLWGPQRPEGPLHATPNPGETPKSRGAGAPAGPPAQGGSGLGPKHQAKSSVWAPARTSALSGSHMLSVKKINIYICLSLYVCAYIYIHVSAWEGPRPGRVRALPGPQPTQTRLHGAGWPGAGWPGAGWRRWGPAESRLWTEYCCLPLAPEVTR